MRVSSQNRNLDLKSIDITYHVVSSLPGSLFNLVWLFCLKSQFNLININLKINLLPHSSHMIPSYQTPKQSVTKQANVFKVFVFCPEIFTYICSLLTLQVFSMAAENLLNYMFGELKGFQIINTKNRTEPGLEWKILFNKYHLHYILKMIHIK